MPTEPKNKSGLLGNTKNAVSNLMMLKVPKCEIFDLFDFNDVYVTKASIGRGLEG
jgi:hypothetical protein